MSSVFKSGRIKGAAITPSTGISSPTVSAISPAFGTTAGGTAVTITGTSFQNSATAKVVGTSLTGVSTVSSTSLTGTTGAHGAATGNVVVTNPDTGVGTGTNLYTYADPTVTFIAPTFGASAGGTSVTITGTWFQTGASVTACGASMTGVTVVSQTSITATTGAHAATNDITCSVVVTNPDAGAATATNQFDYTDNTIIVQDTFESGVRNSAWTGIDGSGSGCTMSTAVSSAAALAGGKGFEIRYIGGIDCNKYLYKTLSPERTHLVGETKVQWNSPGVTSVTVNAGGSGYTSASAAPSGGTCTVQPTFGSVTLSGGAVTAVAIVNPGSCTVMPSIVISGDGSSATATANAGNSCGQRKLFYFEDINGRNGTSGPGLFYAVLSSDKSNTVAPTTSIVLKTDYGGLPPAPGETQRSCNGKSTSCDGLAFDTPHTIYYEVTLNTPGSSDGAITVKCDGVTDTWLSQTNIDIRGTMSNGFYFAGVGFQFDAYNCNTLAATTDAAEVRYLDQITIWT